MCLILHGRFWFVHITFVRMVKLQFLVQFPVDSLAHLIVPSLILFLLHSLIMRLIVLSLSSRNLHLLFCCVLSILALIWLVLMALFYAAIRRDSVSLSMFPFLSHVHVFSCEMSLVSRLKRTQSCFSSHFYFLVIVVMLIVVSLVLILVAVISLPPCFLCSLRVVVSMRQRCLQCWQVLFLHLFLIHSLST